MAKSLCTYDEEKILHFLHRAGEAILASKIQPPTLAVLTQSPRPEFAALAAEFDGPFESETMPVAERDTFASLCEAYFTMVGADAEGNVPVYFRTFAHEESSNWILDDTPLAALMPFPIFGLYLIREGDPFRYGDFLDNVFCYPEPPADAPVNRHGQNAIEAYFDTIAGSDLRTTGDGIERLYSYAAEMDADPRFSKRFEFPADAMELDFNATSLMETLAKYDAWQYERNGLDAINDALGEQAQQDAREWFGGNAVHPKAIMDA